MFPIVLAHATINVCEPSSTGLGLYPYASPILAAVIADVISNGLSALTKNASWAVKHCIQTSITVPGQTLLVSSSFQYLAIIVLNMLMRQQF